MKKNKIVLNIPHSSILGITQKNSGWVVNQDFINNSVRSLTDWFTDMLFTCSKKYDECVIFPYSRFCVDVERLHDDEMEKYGQGILYSEYNHKKRHLSDEDKEYWMMKYDEHHNELKSSLCENAILIDCHSFTPKDGDADICIGFNTDWSYSDGVVEIVQQTFIESGYSVSINKPYSNSITPNCPFTYKSIMIEVNKKVYMDERLLLLNNNPRQWMRWAGCLDKIYERLSEYKIS